MKKDFKIIVNAFNYGVTESFVTKDSLDDVKEHIVTNLISYPCEVSIFEVCGDPIDCNHRLVMTRSVSAIDSLAGFTANSKPWVEVSLKRG